MNRIRTLLALIRVPEDAPPWSLTTAAVTLLFAFLAMLVGAAVAVIWLNTQDYVQVAGWTIGGLLIVAFVWQTRQRDRSALRLVPSLTPVLFIMFICFGCALALDLLSLTVTGEFLPKPELLGLNPNALGVLAWGFAIALMVIVQPIAEGLVVWGVALPALRARLGAGSSLIAAALVSGAFHLLVYPPNYNSASPVTPIWYGLALPIIEALIFGIVRLSTKSTRTAIAAQIAFGLFAVVKLLVLVGKA